MRASPPKKDIEKKKAKDINLRRQQGSSKLLFTECYIVIVGAKSSSEAIPELPYVAIVQLMKIYIESTFLCAASQNASGFWIFEMI